MSRDHHWSVYAAISPVCLLALVIGAKVWLLTLEYIYLTWMVNFVVLSASFGRLLETLQELVGLLRDIVGLLKVGTTVGPATYLVKRAFDLIGWFA